MLTPPSHVPLTSHPLASRLEPTFGFEHLQWSPSFLLLNSSLHLLNLERVSVLTVYTWQYMDTHIHVWVPMEGRRGNPRTRVTDNCELSDMDAGN